MAYPYHCMTNAESKEKEGGFLTKIRGLGSLCYFFRTCWAATSEMP